MDQKHHSFSNRLPRSSSTAKRSREDEENNPREQEQTHEVNNAAGATANQLPPRAPKEGLRVQDQYLPIANITRLMRRVLPSHAKISDSAKETIQECTSEFISFITQEANDRCHAEKRKTITAEDLIYAFSKLGLGEYVEPLSMYLQRYREVEKEKTSLRGELPPHLQRGSNTGLGGGSNDAIGMGAFGLVRSNGSALPQNRPMTRPSPLSRGALLGPSGPGGSSGEAPPQARMSPGHDVGSMSEGGSSSGQATMSDVDAFLNFK